MEQRIHFEKLRRLSAVFAVLTVLFVGSLAVLPQAHAADVSAEGEWGGASYTLYDDGTLAIEDGSTIEDPGSFNGSLKGQVKKITGKNLVLKGSMEDMFWGMTSLADIADLATWDTSNVTSMHSMFSWTRSLSDISALADWETGNVQSMTLMFNTAVSLTDVSALSGWDTSSVVFMQYMFQDCSSLTTVDLSGWKTSNVKNMGGMFYNCSSLTSVDVSGWDMTTVANDYQRISFRESSQLSSLTVGENTRLYSGNTLHTDLEGDTWHNVTKGTFATSSEMEALINAGNGAGTWLPVPDVIDASDSSVVKPDSYVTVEFAAGEHGTLVAGASSKFYVNPTKTVTLTGPSVVAEDNYVNTGWDRALSGVFAGDATITMIQRWIDQVDTPDEHTKFLEVNGRVVVGEEATLDEPSEVAGFTDRHLVKSPANGEVRLASIHYTAKQVGADTFEVAYWMGALSGSPDYIVTYKVEVTAKPDTGDDVNGISDTGDDKKNSVGEIVSRPLSSTGNEVGSPVALAALLLGLGTVLARRSRTIKH